ncbi:MAG TPA: DedA family protein [Candidatus Nanoarchaeia archaeon]|nr:DedA family protein [Candidatus Nanoarchaeia archaeon]
MKITDKILSMPIPVLQLWGYPIVFLSALLEATPFFGIFIPGQTIVIIGGFFAKLDLLNLYYIMILASLGAIIGDLVGYILGRKYGYSFIRDYGKYFFFKKEYFKRTKELMNEYTGKTMIIGRFNSITRAFAPFVAGSSKVPFKKFLFYNIAGGISWGVFFSLVGYIFGKAYKVASRYINGFLLVFFIAAVLAAYFYVGHKRRKKIKDSTK